MEMLRRLFGRNKPAETGETAKSGGEITDWHRSYGFLNIVDANPLDYVDPFPFLRLREDLRRNVLEFVIGASWNGVRTLPEPWTFPEERPEHLRFAFSAAASMRTLTFHARSIKAVCTAVATDVRLLEKTVAKPSAWLEGLWHIDGNDRGSREELLQECLDRAVAAGRGNYAADFYGRLYAYRRVPRNHFDFTCPSAWSEERKFGAEHLFDHSLGGEPHPRDRELAWAHARCRTAEQASSRNMIQLDLPTVDNRFMWGMGEKAFEGFLEEFRGWDWTLVVHTVTLVYRGGFHAEDEHGNQVRTRGTPADYDLLDERLAAFFGAERLRSARWIQQWSDDDGTSCVTRIRDVRDEHVDSPDDANGFLLTHDERDPFYCNDRVQKNRPVATIQVTVADDAESWPQPHDEEDDWGELAPPSYTWISPLESVRSNDTGHTMHLDPSAYWLKLHTMDPECDRGKSFDEAIIQLPLVPGVFEVSCQCTIVGLN